MTAVQTLQQIRSLRVARSDAVRAALEEKTRREAELLSCERRLEDKRTVVSQVQKQKASLLQERRRLRCKLRTDSAAQVLQLAQDDLREEERRIEAEESTLEGLRRRLYGAQQDLRLHAEMKHHAEIEDREKHARDTETERSGPGAAASANPTSALRQEMSEKRRELRTCEAEILRKKERLSRLSMEIEEILERSSLRARPSPSSASSLSVLSSSSSFLADDSKTLFSSAPSSPLADTAEKKRVLRDALDRRCVPGEKTRDKLSSSRSQSRGEHRRSSRRTEAQKTPSSFLGRRLAEEDELFALEAEVTACNQDLPVLEELLQERLAQATLLAGGEERLRPYASVTARNVSRARSAASLAEAVDKQETEAQVTNRNTAESRRETQERKREAEEGRRKVEEKGDEDGDISALFEPRKGDLAYVQLNAAIPGCTYTPGVSPEAEKQRERRAGRSAWFRVSTSLPSSPTAADSEELRGRKDTFRKEDCATHEALSAVRMPQGGNLESATCPLSPLETAQKASHPRGSALRSIVSASVLETSTPASESAAGIHCSFPSSSAASSFVLRSRLSSRGSDSTQEERFSCALSESQLPSRPDSRDASLAAASSLSPPVALPSSSSVAWQQTVAPAGREDECSLSNISSLSMVTPQTKGDVRARLDCAKEAASEPQAGSATPDRSPVSPTKVTEAERSRRGRTKAAWATVSEGNGVCFCADLGNASLLWEDMRAPEQRGTRAEAAEETPWNALLAWASSQTVRASRDSLREKGTPGVNPTACFQDSNFPLPLGRPSPGSSASSVVSHSPASRISPSGCAAAVSCASLGLEAVGRPGAEGGRPARETRETSEETETDLEEDQQRQRQVAGTAFEMSDANLVKNLAKLLALLEALPDVEPRTPEKATEREGRSQVLKSGQTQRGLALERRRRVTLAVERKLREKSPGDPAEKKETCRQESREASSRPSTALRPHLPFCYSSSSSFPSSSKLRCAEQGDTGNRKVAEGIYARRGSASAAFCETNEAGRENGGDENQRRNEKRGRRPLPKATQRDKHEEQKTRNKEARYTKQEQAGKAKEEEGPTSDAPEGRASEEEGPTSDAPEGRASEEERPTSDAPEGRASEEEGPTSDAPEGRASEEEGPTSDAPEGRASEEEGPTSDAPEGRASEEEGPTSDAPEGRASKEEGPTSDAPEGRASEEEGPTSDAPEGRASEEEGPTSDAPEGRASKEEGPTSDAPEGRASKEEGPTRAAPEGRASEEGPTREAPEGRASEEEGPTSDAPEGRASEEEGPTREEQGVGDYHEEMKREERETQEREDAEEIRERGEARWATEKEETSMETGSEEEEVQICVERKLEEDQPRTWTQVLQRRGREGACTRGEERDEKRQTEESVEAGRCDAEGDLEKREGSREANDKTQREEGERREGQKGEQIKREQREEGRAAEQREPGVGSEEGEERGEEPTDGGEEIHPKREDARKVHAASDRDGEGARGREENGEQMSVAEGVEAHAERAVAETKAVREYLSGGAVDASTFSLADLVERVNVAAPVAFNAQGTALLPVQKGNETSTLSSSSPSCSVSPSPHSPSSSFSSRSSRSEREHGWSPSLFVASSPLSFLPSSPSSCSSSPCSPRSPVADLLRAQPLASFSRSEHLAASTPPHSVLPSLHAVPSSPESPSFAVSSSPPSALPAWSSPPASPPLSSLSACASSPSSSPSFSSSSLPSTLRLSPLSAGASPTERGGCRCPLGDESVLSFRVLEEDDGENEGRSHSGGARKGRESEEEKTLKE
uniref:RPGR, putative n=2 Tax=Toxoplasma gondii TaxID=5811 RepID=A0A0F7US61_TOXGV|nr:TPA: RPGR, putative [Toxoplasma gondii VEG]